MIATDVEGAVERYMALPYRIELTPDEGGWFVRIPDLPYCMSQGDTVDEALEMIRDAQRGWLTVALENGQPIPEPRAPSYGEANDHSGRLLIRLPKDLHRDLARAAQEQGVSINLLVATVLARAVGRTEPQVRKPGRPRKQ